MTTQSFSNLPEELHPHAEQAQTIPQHLWEQYLAWVCTTEHDRREKAQAQSEGKAELVKELREQGVIDTPAAPETPTTVADFPRWKNPGTDHAKMYVLGDKVAHNGRVWESRVNGLNSWEPGGVGVYDFIWADVTGTVLAPADPGGAPADPDGEPSDTPPAEPPVVDTPPEFKQPTGGHDAYKQGDRVTFNGAVYESLINANVWTPAVYPQGWKKL